jgi:monoamine oxidase
MTDFTMTDPVLELQRHLLKELPALQQWLDAARAEHEEEPQSEYWLFSFVVRPYVESLYDASSEIDLARAWEVLERIADSGPAAARNELFVTMEELDLWHFYRFMGTALRAHWVEAITWYPTHKTRSERMNTHVNEQEFRKRWLDEIERIGGFEHLTTDQQDRIGTRLWKEFRVERWHQ